MCHDAESSSLAYPRSFTVRASTEISPMHRHLFTILCSREAMCTNDDGNDGDSCVILSLYI